jgi:hypothetical protein
MRPRIARLRTGRQTASPGSACGVGPGFRLALAAALVLAAALGRDVPCRAGLLIEAPSLLATPGSSSSFDLLLVNTNPAGGASYNVAADSFELSLLGPVAVTFTDVSINTIVPYIYVVSGTTVPGGLPLSLDTFPNTQFTASDAEFGPLGFQTVNPGDTFGLAHVSFTVSPTATLGADTIAIASGTATSLSDENGNAIPFAISNGSITVPEPCALAQAATAAMIGLGFWWWRRGKGAIA